ncbi:hypothetical protein KKB40_06185 [Patescibacteria group bacterium]|nr:hypothetical protein [Patescibacteria group bacterium]
MSKGETLGLGGLRNVKSDEEVAFEGHVDQVVENTLVTADDFDAAADQVQEIGEGLVVGEPAIKRGLRQVGLRFVRNRIGGG